MTKDELATALHNLESTVEIKGGKWDRDMYNYVLAQCAWLDEAEFLGALTRCKAELRYPIVPADVLDRCPSLHVQTADEAWASIDGKTEADTVVWTDLAAAAHAEVLQMTDSVAQRMSFKAAYTRMADAWKTAGRRPKVQVSLGTDPTRRADAVRAAVKAGRLPNQEARRLLPEAAWPDMKALPLPREIPQGLVLSEADREYIASLHASAAQERIVRYEAVKHPNNPDLKILVPVRNGREPTREELRDRLGPYADDKMRLYLASAVPTAEVYESGCMGCGAPVVETGEHRTTHCDLCKPEHTRRSLERQAAADLQNKRESDALARMRGATK